MAYYLVIPFSLLPVLVGLCVLVRLGAPHRPLRFRAVVGASVGGWAGVCVPLFYDVNRVAELVRQTKLHNAIAYQLLNWLGFSGSHNEWVWLWNMLVIVFWFTLLPGVLAYWSAPRAGVRPGWGTATLLVLLTGRVLYCAFLPVRPDAAPSPWPQPLQLTLRQPGLLPYPLGGGQVEGARYDSVCFLTLSGTLPRGETLRVNFQASVLASPRSTNLVEVRVGGRLATQAIGQSTYHRATNTVTGHFSCLLPGGHPLRGSFAQTGLTIP